MDKKLFTIILVVEFFCCSGTADSQEKNLPDLIIDNVSYTLITPTSYPPKPIPADVYFTITVKNIGVGDIISPFYISFAYQEQDFVRGHYSHSNLVNNPPLKIEAGQSIKVELSFTAHILKEYGSVVKFLIQTDGKKHIMDILPKVDESNYNNNTYSLRLKF